VIATAQQAKLSENVIEELWFGEDNRHDADDRAADSLAAKLAEFHEVKPFPAVVERLLNELNRSDYDVVKTQEMVQEDPVIASKILYIANSAAFAGRSPCETISAAVVRLGGRTLQEIILSVATMSAFNDVTGIGQHILSHCSGTAAVMRALAMQASAAVENAFLVGLLHDLGKLLLLQSQEPGYEDVKPHEDPRDTAHVRERELLGYDHAILGAHVMRSWNFADTVTRAVAWHHQPGRAYAGSSAEAPLVALLRVSDVVEAQLAVSTEPDGEALEKMAKTPDFDVAGLTAKDILSNWDFIRESRSNVLATFR